MILDQYLEVKNLSLKRILDHTTYSLTEVNGWDVLEYPDDLLYVLAKQTNKPLSLLISELLFLENKVSIRRISSDYSLKRAFDSEAPLIFLTPTYRKSETRFLIEVLIEMKIFEPDLGPLARFNVIGKTIYEGFLKSMHKTEEFSHLEHKIKKYFVLVHDKGGSLLCLSNYLKQHKRSK